MSSVPATRAVALAEAAHDLVQSRPLRARVLAEEALELADSTRDAEGRVAALHALGFARYTLGDPRALATVRAAVRVGERTGFVRRSAMARRNLAMYLAYAGKPAAAVREIEAAREALDGVDRARTEVHRIAVLHLAGRPAAELASSAEALRTLRRHGDTLWEARVLYNRGAALAERGAAHAARRDLERARDLYAALGLEAAVADARIKLAHVRFLEGDVLACLSELEAVGVDELSDWAGCWLILNRAEAHTRLRLLPEARDELRRFVDLAAGAKAVDSVDKARLEAARLALLAGDSIAAKALADSGRRSFAARGQTTFSAAATLLSLAASVRLGSVRISSLRSARRGIDALSRAGWTLDALRGHLLIARAATVAGSQRTAARELAAARPLERRGSVIDRIELRHVTALVRLADGDVTGAERALRAGLQLLEQHRAALGAVELRATASGIGSELSRDGLRLALASGKPDRILAWAERLRGNALRLPPVRPPADRKLREHQTELRALVARIHAEEDGRASRSLLSRQTQLEAAIRSRSRHVQGPVAPPTAAVRPRRAAAALGARVLVEYVELDGALSALTLLRGRLELHPLGSERGVAELEWLRFSLGRLARRSTTPAQRAAALDNARAAAAALDRLLVEPLLSSLGDASLVVVPTGELHALPWGALPSLRGRPIVVAPSLTVWLDLASRPHSRRRRAALVAGPRLRQAVAEVGALAAHYPRATVLTGQAATAEATLAALDGAALGHLACHGRFRADSPLFSSLELADGPLSALDLQGLRRAPDVLVLSSCDLALSDRHPGDELLGLSAALLGMGTRTIVASVVPVPDAAARRLMLAFHRELSSGASPATALARAQAALRGSSSALAGFVCLGSG